MLTTGHESRSALQRLSVLLSASLGVALILSMGSAATSPDSAQADRCQPLELVLGPGNNPIPEENDPVCQIMLTQVYPRLACDSTTLMSCLNTLSGLGTVQKNDDSVCLKYGHLPVISGYCRPNPVP